MRLDVSYRPPGLNVNIGSGAVDANIGNPVIRETVVVGGSLPLGGNPGDVLLKTTVEDFASAWVPPADHAEEDNTRPITAAAVYTEIGNINALLATI